MIVLRKMLEEYFDTIDRIYREANTTVLLIGQNAVKAVFIVDGGYVTE